jgi:glycosyltransferase involved in cell wall biosynthesis
MNICLIGCWFKNDMYSHHLNSLRETLEQQPDLRLRLITSNCNCYSSAQRYGIAHDELLNSRCTAIKLPYAPPEPSKSYGMFKYRVAKTLRLHWIFETLRGIRFYRLAKGCDVVHFDQVLRSFGVVSLTTLLRLSRMSGQKVMVTVHELDPLQVERKTFNRYYALASKILVFSDGFRDHLVGLGFNPAKIETVPFCVQLQPLTAVPRDQFIFFGGHNLLKGKGFDALLGALGIIRERGQQLKVVIYTGKGCNGLEEGKQRATALGLDRFIRWSEFLYGKDLADEYQRSIACLIPYTGGSGRHAVTNAMANATPVIATRKADLPEYLEDLGIYIAEDSARELADAMGRLKDDPAAARALGIELRKRAESKYSKEVIGGELLKIYREVCAA